MNLNLKSLMFCDVTLGKINKFYFFCTSFIEHGMNKFNYYNNKLINNRFVYRMSSSKVQVDLRLNLDLKDISWLLARVQQREDYERNKARQARRSRDSRDERGDRSRSPRSRWQQDATVTRLAAATAAEGRSRYDVSPATEARLLASGDEAEPGSKTTAVATGKATGKDHQAQAAKQDPEGIPEQRMQHKNKE